MERRAIWPTATYQASATPAHCTPFTLPSNGVIELGSSSVLTLTSDAVFRPECTGTSNVAVTTEIETGTTADLRDPFYASVLPECYVLAATTVIAYMLLLMLLLTPRAFLSSGTIVLGRCGFTNGPSSSDGSIGIGGRPWLQKVAALTVVVSLTIATTDTFRVAEQQYEQGYSDANAIQSEVEDGLEMKVIQVISDTFLWLAQAQTLIRLFPRQREKVIIKWTAFALIFLDTLFALLNHFVYAGGSRPKNFEDAIPALSYLFQLALGLLYSAWVIYYSLTKHRYAFYHPQMPNICIVAFLSIISILVPVVFFVLDISQPDVAVWGDYVRWVGAAAASVVVWEWVERIEALERNDKKDGILGREIFDGDEMLEITPSLEFNWPGRSRRDAGDGGESGMATGAGGKKWPAISGLAHRYIPRHQEVSHQTTRRNKDRPRQPQAPVQQVSAIARPPAAATPVSRTDTTSAESTVYAIRYHPIGEPLPPHVPERSHTSYSTVGIDPQHGANGVLVPSDKPGDIESASEEIDPPETRPPPNPWASLAEANPFRRRPQKPPAEVLAHSARTEAPLNPDNTSSSKWNISQKFKSLTNAQAEESPSRLDPTSLPLTVIPAPQRRRNLARVIEELEAEEGRSANPAANRLADQLLVLDTNATLVNTASPTDGRPTSSSFLDSQRQSQRDPYMPVGLNPDTITRHGSLFLTHATQSDSPRQRSETEESHSSTRGDGSRSVNARQSANSRTNSSRSSAATRAGAEGLPLISIPAPPRSTRLDDED